MNAVQTSLALVDVIEIAPLVVKRIALVAEEPVDAGFFNAVVTPGAVFPPIDDAQLAHGTHPG